MVKNLANNGDKLPYQVVSRIFFPSTVGGQRATQKREVGFTYRLPKTKREEVMLDPNILLKHRSPQEI